MTDQMDDPQAQGLYKLFIHDLELPCSIGVHAFERNRPQRVRVSLTLWVRRAGDDGEEGEEAACRVGSAARGGGR